MAGNVVDLDIITRLDLPPEKVLRKALSAGLEDVVVVGYQEGGDLYFSFSLASGPEVLWRLQCAIKALLDGSEE